MTNQAAEEKVCVFSFDLKVKTKERKFQITDRCIGQHCCRHREDKIVRNTGRFGPCLESVRPVFGILLASVVLNKNEFIKLGQKAKPPPV